MSATWPVARKSLPLEPTVPPHFASERRGFLIRLCGKRGKTSVDGAGAAVSKGYFLIWCRGKFLRTATAVAAAPSDRRLADASPPDRP